MKSDELLQNIRERLPELQRWHDAVHQDHGLEEIVYRFYHQSLKVYQAQTITAHIAALLKKLAPQGTTLDDRYLQIVREGTGKEFSMAHNFAWEEHTRPIVEAFLHTVYFLDMAVKYGQEDPYTEITINGNEGHIITYGWAALLELYNIR